MADPVPSTLKTCLITMRFEPETLPRALGLLGVAVGPIEVKPGCRMCRVERDTVEEGLVHYREEWSSEDAFERHVRSNEFWPILVAIDLSAKKPQVAIGGLSERQGLDHLLALRKPAAYPNGTGTELPQKGSP